jgi:hypothetical protein
MLVDNLDNLQTNLSTHGADTSNKTLLPISNFQKSVSYAGIKVFNSLPSSVFNLKNDKFNFKTALRKSE